MSYERKNALNILKKSMYEKAKLIGKVFERVDADHESTKLCPRCIRDGDKRIIMGIKYNIDNTIPQPKKTVYVCGTCGLQISEAKGQSPMYGALNKNEIVSLINDPEGKASVKSTDLGDYSKRRPTGPGSPDEPDTRYLKDIVADMEKNYINQKNMGSGTYLFKRNRVSTSSDIHNSKY